MNGFIFEKQRRSAAGPKRGLDQDNSITMHTLKGRIAQFSMQGKKARSNYKMDNQTALRMLSDSGFDETANV